MPLRPVTLALASALGLAVAGALAASALGLTGEARGAPTAPPTMPASSSGSQSDGPLPGWMMQGVDPQQGEPLYRQRCAGCHDNASGRTPARAAISTNTPAYVFGVLSEGIMRPYTDGMTDQQRMAVALYLGKGASGAVGRVSSETPACTEAPPRLELGGSGWNGWGAGPTQPRFQPDPGFAAADVPRLKLKWAIGMSGARSGQPVLAGGRLFTNNTSGTVYSLNPRTGCAYWRFEAGAGSRNTLSIAPLPRSAGPARFAAYFVDATGFLYALDAESGRQIWKVKVDRQPATQFTGSVIVHDRMVYVPVSSAEEALATRDAYECCKFRGAIVAVDAATGRLLWTTYTTPTAPQPTKVNAKGVQMWGPAGGAIWSAPTVDAKRGLLYVATGDNYTDTPHEGSDAVMALELKTGKVAWVNQVTEKDSYIIGCPRRKTPATGVETGQGGAPAPAPGATRPAAARVGLDGQAQKPRGSDQSGANCPTEVGGDYDFGMTPILHTLPTGKQLILVGQKSSQVYALDPDAKGRIVWKHRISVGGPLGGVEFGGAADGQTLYIGVADLFLGPLAKPSVTAFNIADGAIRWTWDSPKRVCRWANPFCDPAVSMAVSAMPGAVFAGSMNGWLQALDAASGKVLWEVNTAASPYKTLSGREALGGALDGSGPVIGGGMVYVQSGYWGRSGPGGTVLLAYSLDGR